MAKSKSSSDLSKHVAVLRIIFGILWTIDAIFKWRRSFANGFLDQINSVGQNQPTWLSSWFSFWSHFLAHSPHFFAVLVAIIESLIAIALLTGLARRTTYLSAAVFSLLIWSVAEGFGGPYTSTSTDVGAGIIYAIVFFSLYGLDRLAVFPSWSIDNYIIKKLPWWSFVANP